jgi:hypothetical protein
MMMHDEHKKELTDVQRRAIRVAVEFVQTGDFAKLKCMPLAEDVDQDMKLVLAYTVIMMGRMNFAHTFEQQKLKWVIFYWGGPRAQSFLKSIT